MTIELPSWPKGRVGVVAIVGRPNVGKSTFLNQVLGYHLTAVTDRPQTTRKGWRGILSTADSQIIFLDTPGIHIERDELGKAMLYSVQGALKDADAILCLCDPTREFGKEDQLVVDRVAAAKVPTFLAINKSDVARPEETVDMRFAYVNGLPDLELAVEVSAKKDRGLQELLNAIRAKLPEGPFLYPEDELSDSYEREIGAELIREAAMEQLFKEVPHCLAVQIDQWSEDPEGPDIMATLLVETESQKRIVIGKGGNVISRIRKAACKRLREVVDGVPALALHVKVSPGWRNRRGILRDLGIR